MGGAQGLKGVFGMKTSPSPSLSHSSLEPSSIITTSSIKLVPSSANVSLALINGLPAIASLVSSPAGNVKLGL